MNPFSKSTRDIVSKGRPKAPAAPDGEPVGQEPAAEAEAAAADTRPAGGLLDTLLNSGFWQARAYKPLAYAAIIGAALIIAVLLFIGITAPAPASLPEVAENQAIIAVSAETAIIRNTAQGDIVRLYSATGAPVTQLQYVQVYQSGEDTGLLLIVDDVQAEALVQLSGLPKVALVVSGDAKRAAELVEYQFRVNHPTITFALQPNAIMDINETLQLEYTAAIEPAQLPVPEITWASDNPSVVTVRNGTLYPISAGEATITAVCGNKTASCKVTVVINLQAIHLDTTQLTLAVGETAQLAATAQPVNATHFEVTWTVADPAVAAVDNEGVVTAVAPGTTVVTASCGEITASCEITVGYHAEVVQLDKTQLELALNQKGKLNVTIYPGTDLIDEGRWEVADAHLLAIDSDGTIYPVLSGETTVTYICGNASASCVVKIHAYVIQQTQP